MATYGRLEVLTQEIDKLNKREQTSSVIRQNRELTTEKREFEDFNAHYSEYEELMDGLLKQGIDKEVLSYLFATMPPKKLFRRIRESIFVQPDKEEDKK